MIFDKREYAEQHSLEYDILHSDCRDCYINELKCLHYEGKCRKEGGKTE